jgi:hypothetical protein
MARTFCEWRAGVAGGNALEGEILKLRTSFLPNTHYVYRIGKQFQVQCESIENP